MRQLLLLLLFFSTLLFSANAKNLITGSINQQSGTIRVLMRNSPFDNTLTLLAESTISNGKFEVDFDLLQDTEIVFSVNDLTASRQILMGSNWEVKLQIINIRRPDYFGSKKKLQITEIASSSEVEWKIFNIEQDIESIKEKNRKRNGKIGKNYIPELEKYLTYQVIKPNSEEFKTKFITSKIFTYSLLSIKRDKGDLTEPEIYFIDNFQVSFNGLEAINILYTQSILLDFLTNELGKSNYFDFIKKATSVIEDERIHQSTLAVLLTKAVGRKWADPEETKKELFAFIDQCEYPVLKKSLEAFEEHHSNTLVGSELQDFELENPNSDKIRFSDYKGKYLLLDFWATWCGPCIKNMKKLPELKSKNSNLEILCVTTEQDVEKIKKFIKRNGYQTSLNFGIARDKKEIDSYFNKRAIPLYFLVNPQGIIIDKAVTDPIPMIDKHRTKFNKN